MFCILEIETMPSPVSHLLIYFIFKLPRLYVQRDRHLHATLSSGKEQDSDTSPDVTNPTAF